MDHKKALRQHRINTAIFAVLGAVLGYISYVIDIRPLALALAIVVLLAAIKAVQKAFSIEEKKWWGSPVALYIFTWIVVWTILLNLYGLAV